MRVSQEIEVVIERREEEGRERIARVESARVVSIGGGVSGSARLPTFFAKGLGVKRCLKK